MKGKRKNIIKAIGIGTAIIAFAGAVAYATAKAATRKVTDLAESVVENLDDMFGVHTNLHRLAWVDRLWVICDGIRG